MDGTANVAQDNRSQVDLLDESIGTVDHRIVSDTHLVFENEAEAAEEVFDQPLRAEAECDAGDAGAGQQRSDVDAEFVENRHDGQPDDHDGGDVVEDETDRASALGALARVQPHGGSRLPLEATNDQRDGPVETNR